MIWWILPILVFAIWLYFKFNRSVKHKDIIGKKVLVNYFDQNTDFESIFPMTGAVTGKIKVGNQDFFVVQFDKSFVYHNRDFDKIAIKERHAGNYIGSDGEIHVHVCLPKKELTKDNYELTDFDHVVWATIKNV
jgi:hypothetical protein